MLEDYLGRSPDSLKYKERLRLAGVWIALERYTPATLPLRLMEAIGNSPAECIQMLVRRGLDPARFEFMPLKGPS